MTTGGGREIRNMTGNTLCDRLQREYRGRGMGAVQHRRTDTSVMLERIRRGLDPYENAPDPNKKTVTECSFRPSSVPSRSTAAKKSTVQAASAHTSVKKNAAQTATAHAAVKKSTAQTATAHTAVKKSTAQTASAHTAVKKNAAQTASAHAAVKKSTAQTASAHTAVKKNAAHTASAHKTAKKTATVRPADFVKMLKTKMTAHDEVEVRAPFPFAAVTMLSVFTVMLLVLLFSFAQNYELTSEISTLQNDARALQQLEKDLSVQLEERDDIRVIENIAVNELGMVKNDLVESRFVSVSGGDRIELNENRPEEENANKKSGFFSTMLSAIGENFDRLMEYID